MEPPSTWAVEGSWLQSGNMCCQGTVEKRAWLLEWREGYYNFEAGFAVGTDTCTLERYSREILNCAVGWLCQT